jgi:hypothetical protein
MPAGVTYSTIATNTLGSDTATVTFSSIPQTYTDLRLVVSSRVTGSNNSPGIDALVYYNSDQGSNYSYTQLYGNGSSLGSNRASNIAFSYLGVSSNATSNEWPMFTADIMNYSNSTTFKTAISRVDSPATGGNTFTRGTVWRSTANISSITLYAEASLSFKAGSTFTLYGIAAA